MDTNLIHYLPIISTGVAVAFTLVLYRKWSANRSARYLLWWTIGVALYGLGTLAESVTTLFGWSEPVFRIWYVAGALLGGAPLATGTVYLLLPKKRADRIATALVSYIAVAAVLVLVTPVLSELADPNSLSGEVIGAIWSAWSYWKLGNAPSRVLGNILIAIGAILPGIGGGFARAGVVEVLYVTELIGLILIWIGFRVITQDEVRSIYDTQRMANDATSQALTESH